VWSGDFIVGVSGYQPPLELLRHVLSAGGVYDSHRQVFQKLEEASFVTSATLPAAPGQLVHHFTQ
jgi:hypothetical protein